jgi:hypothetical protein
VPNRTEPKTTGQLIRYVVVAVIAGWYIDIHNVRHGFMGKKPTSTYSVHRGTGHGMQGR